MEDIKDLKLTAVVVSNKLRPFFEMLPAEEQEEAFFYFSKLIEAINKIK